MDDHWDEVMALAKKYALIKIAAGGIAVLMCHEVQKEQGIFDHIQWVHGLGKHPGTLKEKCTIGQLDILGGEDS